MPADVEGAVWTARTEHERPGVPYGPIINLVYRVAPEKREALLAYLGKAFAFYERPGGINLALYESIDDPGLFLQLVAYASESEFTADQARIESAPDYKEMEAEWRALIDDEPEIVRMRPVAVARRDVGIVTASPAAIESVWRRRWGLPIYSPGHQYLPHDVEGLAINSAEGETLALVTWSINGVEAEIVSLDSLEAGQGHGTRLLSAAEEALRGQGAKSIRVVISNDNLASLDFFQRRGYRLVRIYPDGMEEVRKIKPGIPKLGAGRVPLRDVWELVKEPLGLAR
jgi:GNAT superfamily N-acetyltransferase